MSDAFRRCGVCHFAKPIAATEDMLCKKRGIVSSRGLCKKFRFDPIKLPARRRKNIDFSRFKAKDFSIE